MRSFNLVGAVALLVASAVSVENEYGILPCSNDICWITWKCSYSGYSNYDNKLGSRCNLPNNVYRPGHDGALVNTLVWEQDYWMEWMFSLEGERQDIVLEWLMFDAPGTESKTPHHCMINPAEISCRTSPRK